MVGRNGVGVSPRFIWLRDRGHFLLYKWLKSAGESVPCHTFPRKPLSLEVLAGSHFQSHRYPSGAHLGEDVAVRGS